MDEGDWTVPMEFEDFLRQLSLEAFITIWTVIAAWCPIARKVIRREAM